MFHVYSVSHEGSGEQRGSFDTFDAAWQRAMVIRYSEDNERIDVTRGNELVWDSKRGRVYV